MNLINKILTPIALIHNLLADQDFIWWPFSFLRPAKQEKITIKHTLTMTACFGGLTFVMFTVFALANNMLTFESIFMTLLFSVGGFFTWFNLITRPLWNFRANQFPKQK